jgi:hypothetical protein
MAKGVESPLYSREVGQTGVDEKAQLLLEETGDVGQKKIGGRRRPAYSK